MILKRQSLLTETQYKEFYQRNYDGLPFDVKRTIDTFNAAAAEIARKRRLLQETTHKHPDNGGKEGELIWIEFIRKIIPDEFKIIDGGRIIDVNTDQWPQLDIIVLKPGAEKKLEPLGYYSRNSVLAAFECKLSLEPTHIETAARHARLVKDDAEITRSEREHSTKPELPIYGLIGTGMKQNKPLDGNTLSATVLDACAKSSPLTGLDFVLVNDVSFVRLSYELDPFDEPSLLQVARYDNFFESRIEPSHVPLLGFAFFLTKIIADFKPEYSHLVNQYEFYERVMFCSMKTV